MEPAPTRATSGEPSHPDAILTPTQGKDPDDDPHDHDRERSGLGRLPGLIVPAVASSPIPGVVSSRLLAGFLKRVERKNHRCSRHGHYNQESANENPKFHVKPEARRRNTDGHKDQDERHESTDGQGPEDGRFHDVPYIVVGNVYENGDLLQGPTVA